jgi:hypothetical protein
VTCEGQRITCDECMTSIADMHVGCDTCGRELCMRCFFEKAAEAEAEAVEAAADAAADAAAEATAAQPEPTASSGEPQPAAAAAVEASASGQPSVTPSEAPASSAASAPRHESSPTGDQHGAEGQQPMGVVDAEALPMANHAVQQGSQQGSQQLPPTTPARAAPVCDGSGCDSAAVLRRFMKPEDLEHLLSTLNKLEPERSTPPPPPLVRARVPLSTITVFGSHQRGNQVLSQSRSTHAIGPGLLGFEQRCPFTPILSPTPTIQPS